MPTRDTLIEWLFSLHGPALKWDLDTARAFCAVLGRPERRFRALHVAGTNGKGSVSAMVHAVALDGGLTAGLFTSPHLIRPEERIRVGPDDIDSGQFVQLLAHLRTVAAAALADGTLPRHPSFFEIMTAAAFLCFAEAAVDLAVVETGLGGRLDATNVVQPELAVITTIGLDHVVTLGPDLASIAREKAGIIKPGAPVLVGWVPARAREVIEERARSVNAPLHAAAQELTVRRRVGGRFDVTTPERTYSGLRCSLEGPHQSRNAALAVRAMELLRPGGEALAPETVARGLAAVRWPGRLERIVGPKRPGLARTFVLDGAHNLDGSRALGRALAEMDRRELPPRRVLVFGVTEGRSAARLIGPLRGRVSRVVVTRPRIDKATDPERVARELAGAAPELRPVIVADPACALERAAALAGAGGEVLVAGSLYLVGDVRRTLLELEWTGHPSRETLIAPVARAPSARPAK